MKLDIVIKLIISKMFMIIENRENLNLILNLPFYGEIIVGKLKYKMLKINFEKRINKLFMQSIGFTPYFEDREYCSFSTEIRDNSGQVMVYERRQKNNNSSYGSNAQDITGAEFLNVDTLLDGFTFILSECKEDTVSIKKYVIKKYESNFSIEHMESISLKFYKKNLTLYKDTNEISIDDVSTFFDDIHYYQPDMFNQIIALIFNSFVDEKGFLDVYKKYTKFINNKPEADTYMFIYDVFKYYYYVGQLDFYFLAEYFIKNQLESDLKNHNPVFTGKPIEKVAEIPVLSKIGTEIFKKYRFDDKNKDILFKMEAHKNIGTDGMKIIYDYLNVIQDIDAYRIWRIPCWLEQIYDILDTFEITPKNLMNRIVRTMFYENLSIDKYTQIVVDYIEMAKMLGIKINKKLPTDIVRLHDLFKDQINYIKNNEIEKMFESAISSNNLLLESLPESDKLTVISPSSPNDLIEEGIILNHCVGSYINRYASGYSKIFFIRNKISIEQPFVTIELNRKNQLVQISGRSNKKPTSDVDIFIENWINNINK